MADILVLESEWLEKNIPIVRQPNNPAAGVVAFLRPRLAKNAQVIDVANSDTYSFPGGILLLSNRTLSLGNIGNCHELVVEVVETPVNLNQLKESLSTLWYRVRAHRRFLGIIDSRTETLMLKLAKAIEHRDKTTGDHVHRVAALTRLLAEKYFHHIKQPLSESELNRLALAAALHDVGKIATPEAVLSKPGQLTDAERETMKNHSQKGYDLLKETRIDVMDLAAEIAKNHHERDCGGGYPCGITGGDIPIKAQIVAIIDVMDALLADRPYKKARSKEDTFRIVTKENETHYNKVLLNVFIQNWELLYATFQTFPRDPSPGDRCSLNHC
ncbi:MAG: HD domain-containing protein [Magnetococcales bacterium]|nr:HD domain-containing protein [Magnetococcales bacterium]MBF0116775.1 HD domain-containing protein [Magnetococcales bacterium]